MATAEKAAATTAASDQRIVIDGVRWETYLSLLADRGDRSVPRMTFDQGELELRSPSGDHERSKKLIGYLIFSWAVEHGIPLCSLGSTTFTRPEQQRGLEPDECYYIQNEALVRGKRSFDLASDPPPDLVLEVDISSRSLKKLKLYAALGIPEVWRFSRQGVQVYRLGDDGAYSARTDSECLPGFPVQDVAAWLARAEATDEISWARSFQAWIRERQSSENA